jgi:hemerythrin-like domain-containing protein/GNAT superfamily N-acetyltransferase
MTLQVKTTETYAFDIETVEAQCDPSAAQLWHELHGPSCDSSHPAVCLVARGRHGGQTLGVAQYFRTFPPEDGCGAVVVVPDARHSGVGDALLHQMLEHAVHNGIRMLETVVDGDDVTTMEMLRTARLPVTVSRTNGRLYVEIDAFHAVLDQAHSLPEAIVPPIATTPLTGDLKEIITMEATTTLETEHNAVLYVLDELDRATAGAASGKSVPTDVFSDIEEVFRVFVTQCHHAKEETEVFPKLLAIGDPLPRQLEQEHEHGQRLEQTYARAVAAYRPGDIGLGTAVQHSAAAYSAFLRTHIATETAELFPAMQRHLLSQDEALVEAFERVETERIGAGVHERLHGMIGGLKARIDPWIS